MDYELLHQILRKPQTEEEKKLLLRCYKEGLKNGWASGDYDKADGNFIVEEDRLNKNSISFIDYEGELIEFFDQGNWCLGMGIIYKNLFFLEQTNGDSEWAIYYIKDNEIKRFESYSIKMVLDKEKGRDEFLKDLRKMLDGTF